MVINLKRILTKFRLSTIPLLINIVDHGRHSISEYEVDAEVEAEPILVKDLNIGAHSSSHCDIIVFHLFGMCRRKFVTRDYWRTDIFQEEGLMHTHDRHNMFGKFGVKEVNMEVYEVFDYPEWRPLMLGKHIDVTKTPKK